MGICIICQRKKFRSVTGKDVFILKTFYQVNAMITTDFLCEPCVDNIDSIRDIRTSQLTPIRERACQACRMVKQLNPIPEFILKVTKSVFDNSQLPSDLCDSCTNILWYTAKYSRYMRRSLSSSSDPESEKSATTAEEQPKDRNSFNTVNSPEVPTKTESPPPNSDGTNDWLCDISESDAEQREGQR